ncbi:MAG: Bax inhibitor-1 family protein [Thermoguttaceae bacterium]|jgi:FtsH-binding integral membrane protein
MSYAQNPYQGQLGDFAALAAADERSTFITKTYMHLAGAIALFAALEAVILSSGIAESMLGFLATTRFAWLIVLGAFMLVSMVASNWAVSAVSPATQYAGLGLYVLAESIIFAPLLYIANRVDPSVIQSAALTTLALFGGLTAAVFITRKDFSFLRTFLVFGGFAAMGFILVAILFQFQLGAIFLYAMIALACGYILYDTSNVLHHYRVGQHVAAALALFASVALLFWYLVQLFMSRRD